MAEKLSKEAANLITAAMCKEKEGDTAMKIVEKGFKVLRNKGVVIDRLAWLKEAESCEIDGCIATCRALVKNAVDVGLKEQEWKNRLLADADYFQMKGSYETARAIINRAISLVLEKKSVHLLMLQLEKSERRESLDSLLEKANTYAPQAEVLWLLRANEQCVAGKVQSARTILREASVSFPKSEEICFAALKLEFVDKQPETARGLLVEARERLGTKRVWMKSAIIESELGKIEEERRLLEEGLQRFPSFYKLWLMLGQLYERVGQKAKAKDVYKSALKHCPRCIPVWVSLATIEEEITRANRARAVLTLARKRKPSKPRIVACNC